MTQSQTSLYYIVMQYILDLLQLLWSSVSPFVGVLIVIILTTVLIIIVKTLLRKKQAAPYYYQITSLILSLFGLFLVVLCMPISDDMKKQILSLLGLLLSAVIALSSTSLIGNAMAGIMLRVSKSYRPGDFIEIENTRGRVFNQGLFSTEVQIITRDTVSFPNLYLIQHPIRVTRSDGSFISTSVSLGYDIPRSKVEESLINAAQKEELEEPFVYVEKLLDHAVEYRIFGMIKETARMLTAKSNLRKSVLDVLHEHNIEIVSPSFVNRREFNENKSFIPQEEKKQTENAQPDTKVEELAFDKAEEAESIEKLKEKYNELLKEKEALTEKAREEDDKEREKIMKEEARSLDERAEKLMRYIEKREQDKREKK